MICGVGLALVAGRLVQGLLVGVSPRDAYTLAVVSATMMGVSVVAASLPAWRAARVDPASVLRGDA
jgi:putative ABC transport system permease protein